MKNLINSRAISKKSCSSSNTPKINGSFRSLHHSPPRFRSLKLKATRVIDSITGINLRFTETEGSVNMCQAVQEMCDDARAEGHASGLSEGHAQGLQDHALLTAQRMLQDSRFSPEDISRFSGLPLEDVLKLREK